MKKTPKPQQFYVWADQHKNVTEKLWHKPKCQLIVIVKGIVFHGAVSGQHVIFHQGPINL